MTLVDPYATLRTATPGEIRQWREVLEAHKPRPGGCRECDVPWRCSRWAWALGELVAHDALHLTPTPVPAEKDAPTIPINTD